LALLHLGDELAVFLSQQFFNRRRKLLLELRVELTAGGRGESGVNVLHAA